MRRTWISRVRQAAVLAGHVVVYAAMWLVLWVAVPAVVLQWTPVVLTSGSMQPGLHVGDVVIASPHSGEDLAPGTVILFEDPASDGLTTHRIVAVDEDGNYRTKGDGNAASDSTLVAPDQVRGVGRLAVPWIGLPRVWIQTRELVPLGMLAAAALGLLGGRVVRWWRDRDAAESEAPHSTDVPVLASELVVESLDRDVWDGVRELLRHNRRKRSLVGFAGRPSPFLQLVARPVETAGKAADPSSPDTAGDAASIPTPVRLIDRVPSRTVQKAAMVLVVAAAILLVLTIAPVQTASAQFIGATGPGGGSVTSDTLDPPTGLAADTSTAGQIGLSWTPTVDTYATGYEIYRSETSGSGYSLVQSVVGQSTSSYTDVFTPTKRNYYYVVRAYYAGWASSDSNEATANVGYHGIIEATSGLVSYWRLGVNTTTSVAPDSWGSNNGTPSGGFTPGVGGAIVGDSDTAASFNGSSGDVNVGNSANLQLNSATVEAWIRTSNAGSGYREIVSKEGVYYLAARANVLGVYDDATGSWRSSGVTINDNAWHHVVLKYQSGVSNGTRIYLDGSLVLTTTITATGQGQPTRIGSWYGGAEFWTGRIDEVAIYNTQLSAAVIGVHHQAGITP